MNEDNEILITVRDLAMCLAVTAAKTIDNNLDGILNWVNENYEDYMPAAESIASSSLNKINK